MTGWAAYIGAGAGLLLSHVVLSAPGVRPALRARLGPRAFMALHAGVSTLALVAFVYAYLAADPGPQLFVPGIAARTAAILLMPLAVFLVLARLTTRARDGDAFLPPQGIYLVTRAPGSLGALLWAAVHILNMGDARRVTAFAIMAAIALWAIVKNEIVLARATDPASVRWRAETSLLRIGDRRAWRAIGWQRPAAAILLYLTLVLTHPYVLGPDPLLGVIR